MQPTDISNPDYFHKVVDCQWACPAHTPVPEYIRLIAARRFALAVVPQDDTVHLSYPSAIRMPLVASPPASYCLYAETVRDNGRLDVTVVATTI